MKGDDGKTQWALLPWHAVREALRVIEYGAKKYGPWDWLDLPDKERRYWEALQRHIFARFALDELRDPESGMLHTAHIAANALFLLTYDYESGR